MHKLLSLLERLSINYKGLRMTGLFHFIGWLLQLTIEKIVIGLQAKLHLHRFVTFFFPSSGMRRIISGDQINKPIITFIIPTGRDRHKVSTTIHSLLRQSNPDWECILCNENEPRGKVQADRNNITDDRIKSLNLHATKNEDDLLMTILPRIKGKWMVITRPGDRHIPGLVSSLATLQADIAYWDEARYRGCIVYDPFYKPDWSPELWLSVDILRCSALNTAILRRQAGIKPGEGLIASLINDTKSIVHLPKLLTHCTLPAWEDSSIIKNHVWVVEQYLRNLGIRQPVVTKKNNSIRVSWEIKPELVSIIIPSKNNVLLLKTCIKSIFQKTVYQNFEIIIVDNKSTDEKTLKYYSHVGKIKNVHIINIGSQFNFSHACNAGAKVAKGKYLLFLNNDIEVVTPNWIKNLVAFASFDRIGVVGGKLLFPNDRIQHAGIVLGLEGHASHVFMGVLTDRHSPFGSVEWYRNYSAVTGACLMIRKDVFTELNGFDERFSLIFNDVDLCLKAWKNGYRTVYNPEVVLIHQEGKTREKYNPKSDIILGYERFKKYIEAGDPFYNPRLSRAYRIPTVRKGWEQTPIARVKKIIKFTWY